MREKFKNDADRLLRLQRQDPIAFWLRRAHESAGRLNLPVEFLGETIGIIAGALSEQWIGEKVAARRKGMLGAFHGHPLIKALTVAGDNDLVTVVELAIYLKQLSKIPGLYQVIQESLRADNKFDSALLQLAWAYRFQKMGAQVELEPLARSRSSQRGVLLFSKSDSRSCIEQRRRAAIFPGFRFA